MSFKYTIEEIDEFRHILHDNVSYGSYTNMPSVEAVEAQIRTYMTAGIRPAEVRAKKQAQWEARRLADAQRRAKELIQYCQYDGQSSRAIWTLQAEAIRRDQDERLRPKPAAPKKRKSHWWDA